MAGYFDIQQYPGRRMPNVRARPEGGYDVVGTPDPNEGMAWEAQNPKYGEVGWNPNYVEQPRRLQGELGRNPEFGEIGFGSARPLSQPDWAQWYDLYMAGGGGNPVSHEAFRGLQSGSPEGSNQLRGESSMPGVAYRTPLLNDPYYNTAGIGPRYQHSADTERQVLTTDVEHDVPAAQRRAFRGLQNAINIHGRPTPPQAPRTAPFQQRRYTRSNPQGVTPGEGYGQG